MEYASKGVAGAALGTGIGGLALGAVNSGLLDNLFGGRRCGNGYNDGNWGGVDRYELTMTQQMANKDMEIAYWRGQDETNKKISDAYAKLEGQINHLAHEVQRNKDEQNGINLQQAVYNGTNTATIGCIRGQIDQLYSLTRLRIPNGVICPGWGDVTVTPTPAAAAAAG